MSEYKETTIAGFEVSLEIESDCSSGWINKGNYGGSLEFMQHYGYIEGDDEADILEVSERVQQRVMDWADANGY